MPSTKIKPSHTLLDAVKLKASQNDVSRKTREKLHAKLAPYIDKVQSRTKDIPQIQDLANDIQLLQSLTKDIQLIQNLPNNTQRIQDWTNDTEWVIQRATNDT